MNSHIANIRRHLPKLSGSKFKETEGSNFFI